MFGRMRPASSSLDSLELERPPPKIIKDDSLSIYEATLMKLKLGSLREVSSPFEEAVDMEGGYSVGNSLRASMESVSTVEHDYTSTCSSKHRVTSAAEEATPVDMDCSSASDLTSSFSSDRQSAEDLKQKRSSSKSILYLFSRYSNSRHLVNPSRRNAITQSHGSISASQTSSDCLSSGIRDEHSGRECIGFLSSC